MGYFVALLLFFHASIVQAAPLCKPEHLRGQDCWVEIQDLYPTQTSLGMVDVEDKVKEIDDLSSGGVKKYLKKNAVKLVVGPGGKFYLIDGHHLTRAVWEHGYTEVRAVIVDNYAHLSERDFLARMKREGKIRLADKDGKALSKLSDLPKSIGALKNDPYRSLAWLLRKSGAIRKTDVPFAEFYWADFLRKHVKIGSGTKGMEKAFAESLAVMATESCQKLPGYVRRHASACPLNFHLECASAFKAMNVH